MKALLILLLCLLVTSPAGDSSVSGLFPSRGMGVVFDLSVAVRAGEITVGRAFKPGLGNEERDVPSASVLLDEGLVPMALETG